MTSHYLQIAVDMLKSVVGAVVITTTDVRFNVRARITVIRRRLLQQTKHIYTASQ